MKKRKILFITGCRSDFYIQKPIIDAATKSPFLRTLLVVTGAHLSKKFGKSLDEIVKGKYNIIARIKNLKISDNRISRLNGASIQLMSLAKVIKKFQPDLILSPFDREESITTAIAGAYMNIPVAHLGAGDRTRVNIDGVIRHGVTKLSNIFFCFTPENAKRVIKMGEEKWRVYNVGHTAVERYENSKLISNSDLSEYFKLNISKEPLLIFIQHPVSNWLEQTKKHINISLSAIDELNFPTIIIRSNSDPGTKTIKSAYEKYKFTNKKVRYFENIPEIFFVNILRKASVLVGNSSMGVLEAPYLKLPVVNIGLRQKDRQNAGNILFVSHNKIKIINAIKKSIYNKKYLKEIRKIKNPYGKSGASNRIVKILSKIRIDQKLINKKITY